MNIDDLTVRQIKEIKEMFCSSTQTLHAEVSAKTNHPYEIGKNYLIRTVTMTQSGRLVFVGEHELVLEDAAWIADTGSRFADSLKDCNKFSEVEPFDKPVIIGRGAIVDATEINDLITVQK